MQKYSREIVADILAATDIVDVIGGYVELKSAGSNRLKGLCPFHGEKTPSFTVSRDRQMFYCFGCQKHGDAIGFLIEYENLPFADALRKLADRAGIRMPEVFDRDNRDEHLRAQLVELGKFAAHFYLDKLNDPLKGSAGRQYLKTRQLKPETVKRFGLGYAPEGWSNLADAARPAGFSQAVLESSGLVRRGERDSIYDFFRNRFMIPIRDVSGNVAAFGGRTLGDDTPKYINSPENALYKKSRVLYGLHEARDAMRHKRRAILVEGYFDLMRCFDAGIENVVATCGTALTPEQATLIHRYVPEVVIVYDADAAGIRAALRGVGLLTNAGLTVRAMTLPAGKDPDDFISLQGGEAFRELVENAMDFVSFYTTMSADRTGTIEGRAAVAREVFSILTGMHDELRREEYLKRTASALSLNEWTCRGEFSKFQREQSGRDLPRNAPEPAAAKSFTQDDCDFIAALLQDPAACSRTHEALATVTLEPGPLTEVLETIWAEPGPKAALRLETDAARGLYAASANNPGLTAEKAAEIVEKRVARLRKTVLQAEVTRLVHEIQAAERSNEGTRVTELQRKKIALSRELDKIGAA